MGVGVVRCLGFADKMPRLTFPNKSFTEIFMAIERTLSIIKPDAVAKNVIGKIYQRFEDAGLKVIAARMTQLSEQQAG